MKLRQAMLINGMLYNSEAWHAITEAEIRILETVDESLLRALVNGHAKTPLEFLYLEAGAMPIRFILSARRLTFHQTILKREKSEITRKIYEEQKLNPTAGDFVELIMEDFKIIDKTQKDEDIRNTNTKVYKSKIKSCVKSAAFNYLKQKLRTHSKVKHIEYKSFETQKYMTSPIFTDIEVNLLHRLRSRSTECKENFKQKYIHTNIRCSLCDVENEDQRHLLSCRVIQQYIRSNNITISKVEYQDLFSQDVRKQKEITTLYLELFQIRTTLLNNSQVAPSSTTMELTMGKDVQYCIDYSLSGK